MQQITNSSVDRLLKVVVLLQILTIAIVAYLFIERFKVAASTEAEDLRYQESVREHQRAMAEYRETTERYEAALEAWKRVPDNKGVQPHPGANLSETKPPQHNAGSRPSSDDSSASEIPSSLGPRG